MRKACCLGLCLFAILVWASASPAAECVPSKAETVKKKIGACEIETTSGRFTKGTFYIDYSGASLVCGDKTFIDGAPVINDAQKACVDFDSTRGVALPYSATRDILKISDYRGLISVEVTSNGYTGGAHEYAMVKYATFDMKTGVPVTLESLYGKEKAAKIILDANKLFDKKDLAVSYRFDPDSFAVADAGSGKVKITFAAPHEVELYRGTVLEISVTTPAPVPRKPGK